MCLYCFNSFSFFYIVFDFCLGLFFVLFFLFFGWRSCHGVLLQYQNLIKHTKITKWILIQVVLSIVFVCTEDNLSDMNTAVEVFVVEYFDVVLNGHQMAVNACIYAVFPNSRNDS